MPMMDNEDKLLAAVWTMWGAIQNAHANDVYNENINSVYDIAKQAMERSGQLEAQTVESETGC